MAQKNQDHVDRLAFIPRNSPPQSRTIPSMTESSMPSFLDLLPPPSPCIRLKDTALPPRLALVLGPPPPLTTPPSLVIPGWYLLQLCYRASVVAWQLFRFLN